MRCKKLEGSGYEIAAGRTRKASVWFLYSHNCIIENGATFHSVLIVQWPAILRKYLYTERRVSLEL